MALVREIISTDNVIKVSPIDTMSSALAKLSTSHDAAFSFNDDGKFLGVINPYYCLIKSSYPGNAKVEHCLFHPPHVSVNDSVERVAQLFIESKIHYLPVFDEKYDFIGIVSANRLINMLLERSSFKVKIGDLVRRKNKALVTVYENDPISQALKLFKNYKISKLVVIGKDMKLRGILSYYDLIFFLISPREKAHQGEREGNKIGFYHQPVKNFSKTSVITMQAKDTMLDAIKLVFEKKIGSVVIVDEERRPVHIMTKTDFLSLILRKQSSKPLQVVNKNLSSTNRQIIKPFFTTLNYLINKIPGIARARVFIKEEKQGGVFKIVLSLIPVKGSAKIIAREGKNLHGLLTETVKKLLGLWKN